MTCLLHLRPVNATMVEVVSNGLRIKVEQFGNPADPPVLLIMGLATQLIAWPEAFIQSIVDKGFYVIAFDNRDIGLSEKLSTRRASSPILVALLGTVGLAGLFAPYKLTDMSTDTLGVMDALNIGRAHVIGASMGGMIGQILCAENPTRIRSFTAIMSSTNNPALPRAHPKIALQVLTARKRSNTREELIDATMRIWTLIGTRDSGRDPDELRRQVTASVDRNSSPSGIRRQMAAIIATRDLRHWTRRIAAPSLVIHGSHDPLVPLPNGFDIAAEIENARMEVIEGMGHDLPPKHLAAVVNHVLEHLCSAESRVATKNSNQVA